MNFNSIKLLHGTHSNGSISERDLALSLDMKHSNLSREMRSFGLVFSAIVCFIFGLVLPLATEKDLPRWPWFLAIGVVSLAIARPLALKSFYKVWMKLGGVLGFINSRVILSIIFYFLIFPFGKLWRLFVRDPLNLKIDKSALSYRVFSTPMESISTLERPY